jgi:hypothetical protein
MAVWGTRRGDGDSKASKEKEGEKGIASEAGLWVVIRDVEC